MGWNRGRFSTSYREIMSHLYDECRMADGSINEGCVARINESLQREKESEQKWVERYGDTLLTMSEAQAMRNYFRSRYGDSVQAQMYLEPFERPAVLHAIRTKGRVVVDYGSALPEHQEVEIQGPHGSERSFDFHNRGAAAYMQRTAEELFEKRKPKDIDEERELLEELYQLYRRLF